MEANLQEVECWQLLVEATENVKAGSAFSI